VNRESRSELGARCVVVSSIRTHAHFRKDTRTYTPESRRTSRSLPPLPGVYMLIFTDIHQNHAGPRFPSPDRIFAHKKKSKTEEVNPRQD